MAQIVLDSLIYKWYKLYSEVQFMLFITDNLIIKSSEASEAFKLDEFANRKIFTVADTPLTYRQVNSLDTDNLLTHDRRKGQGWRKFSLKELVYILIVNELKNFGLKHGQLNLLWQAFFKEPEKSKVGEYEVNKNIGEIAIGCVFGQIEIVLSVDKNGQIAFYDPTHYVLFPPLENTCITIRLNNFVNKLLIQIEKEAIPITWSIQKAVFDLNSNSLTTKEKDLLSIIRNNEYTAVKIKKTNGELGLVYAEKVKSGDGMTTEKDLIKMVSERDFQDISLIKRDGKIVNYKIEETIKL